MTVAVHHAMRSGFEPDYTLPMDFDLIVVGGGLAGMSCGIRGVEQGLKVAVLERGEEDLYACNSRFANGFINIASEYIHSPPEQLRKVIEKQTYGFAEAELAETLS